MNIKGRYKLYKSLILHPNNTNHIQEYFNSFILKEWQLLLISDGSCTQALTSLTGKLISIGQLRQYNYKFMNDIYKMREVLLKDYQYNTLVFAKSLWLLSVDINLPKTQPVGKSLIMYQKDIYRIIHEFYYGYCTYLESKFGYQGPIWGRKYTIYYKQERLTTLHEIFAPRIINCFDI